MAYLMYHLQQAWLTFHKEMEAYNIQFNQLKEQQNEQEFKKD